MVITTIITTYVMITNDAIYFNFLNFLNNHGYNLNQNHYYLVFFSIIMQFVFSFYHQNFINFSLSPDLYFKIFCFEPLNITMIYRLFVFQHPVVIKFQNLNYFHFNLLFILIHFYLNCLLLHHFIIFSSAILSSFYQVLA